MSTCHFCPTSEPRMINGNHWNGEEYVRVDVCTPCFTAGKLAKHPRKPRQRRQPTLVPATDGNYLALLMGAKKVKRK